MSLLQAIALGLIQGIAELFPISSAAHTLLISWLFGWTPPSLPFVVMLHLGTFLAVLVYFARDYWEIVIGLFTGVRDRWAQPHERLAILVVLGTVPLAIAGYLLEKPLDPLFGKPIVAAVGLLITGGVLFAVERLPQGSLEAEQLPLASSFWVGLSQIAGLVPGGSRSGFSIAAGMLAGLTREQAARFSFLLAGPAILGASMFELRRIIHPHPGAPATVHGFASVAAAPEPRTIIVVGFLAALISGIFAIRFFMRFVDQHKLTPFAIYCWVVGLASIVIILARGHTSAFITPALADTGPASVVTFSDGAVATSYDHCGDTDLCATVKYANGDLLSIYSEGAAYCQPYLLNFVLVNGTTTIYQFSRTMNHDPIPLNGTSCGHSRSTTMVMDHGLVHLTVSENPDGTLRLVFSK